MNKERVVTATFNALYALIDLRFVWRRIKPEFRIDASTREEIKGILSRVREQLRSIEEEVG